MLAYSPAGPAGKPLTASQRRRAKCSGMEASFEIDVDVVHSVVRMTMGGFYDAEAIDRFRIARREAFGRLRCAPNQHVSIVDIRAMKIQSQEMVAAFHTLLADPAFHSRRFALVVASSLARLQLQRAVDGRAARYFTDHDEAERWATAADEERAA